ncbi:hypothetical protein B0H11DRAFT_2235240 [Mycena galericulata]|nr:hypothetical protein B0H11DRAFT_2235240 [Mycena galericulata]
MDVLKEHPELAASVLKVLSDALIESSQQQVQELERRLAEEGVAIAQNAGGSLVSLAEENEHLRTDLDELRLKREVSFVVPKSVALLDANIFQQSLSLKSDLAASVDKDKIEKLECDLLELRREYDQQMLKEKDAQIGQLQNDVVAPERNHQTLGSLVQASQHEVWRLADRVNRQETEYRDLHEQFVRRGDQCAEMKSLLLDCDMVRETAVSTLRQENILLKEEKTGITEHALMVRHDL